MEKIKPVLKWAGGKRQLLSELMKYIPEYTIYYEPFLGGGALLFELQPKIAVINDINKELINVYKVIKDNVEDLIVELSNQEKYKNTAESFYAIRKLDRNLATYNSLTNIEKAARTLYLNKTCYNGLYRVNNNNEFNTPFGKFEKPNIINEIGLRAVSKYFNENDITFLDDDFTNVINNIEPGSFVYLDPPYAKITKTSHTKYDCKDFKEYEQITLKHQCDILNEKQIKFLLSNSSCSFIRELYKDYTIVEVAARRTINSDGSSRGKVTELLIKNY